MNGVDETQIEAETRALYQSSLDGFVDARKALAAKLKKAGAKDAAAKVAAIAKPIASAWATNRVAVEAADVFADLERVGALLRAAMRDALHGKGSGADVAKHQAAQRDAIEALVSEAGRILEAADSPPSDTVLARVRTSLTTIGTSGRWGDAAPYCLSKDLLPLDVGALAELLEADEPAPNAAPAPKAPAAKPGAAKAAEKPAVDEDAKRREREAREAKQRELERAASEADDARVAADAALVTATAKLDDAHSEASRLATRATEATEEAAKLEAQAKAAAERMHAARRELDAANAALSRAKKDRDAAQHDYERKSTRAVVTREAADRHRGAAND